MDRVHSARVESPCDVLGIESDAEEAEIIRAYRRRVKEVHPDQGGSVREFKAVRTAYERLRTGDDTRIEYESAVEQGHDGEPRDGEVKEEDEEGSEVEYLNYAVLDDFEWGLDDEDLFDRAADENLGPEDYGRFVVEPNEFLLEAAENRGFRWPYACRGGACSNCAVALIEGEMPPPANHVLPTDLIERGIRLSCVATPITEDAKVVYNVKHLPGVDELLLPASRFEQAYSSD